TFSRAYTRFRRKTAAWIAGAGVLVKADEQHRWIILKSGLSPISMVNVEIDDRNFFDAVGLLKISCGNGEVRKKAEAHWPVGLGVVPRRADGRKRTLYPAIHNSVAALDARADAQQGDFKTGGADRRVALIEHATA